MEQPSGQTKKPSKGLPRALFGSINKDSFVWIVMLFRSQARAGGFSSAGCFSWEAELSRPFPKTPALSLRVLQKSNHPSALKPRGYLRELSAGFLARLREIQPLKDSVLTRSEIF